MKQTIFWQNENWLWDDVPIVLATKFKQIAFGTIIIIIIYFN
jgi:hypothetical protein